MPFRLKSAVVISLMLGLLVFLAVPSYSADVASADSAVASSDSAVVSSDIPTAPDKLPELTGPKILSFDVVGNKAVVSEHIMSVITSKVGEPVDEEKLRKDAEAIFELGFFVATDYKVTDADDGVNVTFQVQENPVVGSISFKGNTVYSSEKLTEMLFTRPGMIFNRTFFRNDLQRIKEKYQQDGYVMANVADVQIDGDAITVVIVEPKISQIVIQGNKITKKHVVQRYLKIKEGEIFNSNKLRLTLNRLQGVGFFSDVNVNFEPGENPDDVIIVITVEEGRTGRLGFNVSYGTQSGFGGGLTYENFNIGGKGLKLNVGFELGDRQEYWLSFEQPYMSGKVTAWKVGVYKRAWDDLYYYYNGKELGEYDRDKMGAYIGFGRKFRDESKYNWYVTLDWHKV
ncbi:MAG: POTRA domain-containing protein, partial [Synergistaceae bacterium]